MHIDIAGYVIYIYINLQKATHLDKLYCCRKLIAPDASSKFLGVKETWKTGVAFVVSVFSRLKLEVSFAPES